MDLQEYFYDINDFHQVVFLEKGYNPFFAVMGYRYESVMLFIHDTTRFVEGSKLEVNSDYMSCVFNYSAHMRFVSTQKVSGTCVIKDFCSKTNKYRIEVDLLIDEPEERYNSYFKGTYSIRFIDNPGEIYKVLKYKNEELSYRL